MKVYNLLLLCLLVFGSCTHTSHKNLNSATIAITDSYNRNVVLDTVPTRVVSVAPGITEIMFALGQGGKLVGRTDYCLFPNQVLNIPSIGGMEDPNIETIAKLHPDLVIASTHFRKETLGQIEQLHIPVIVEKGQDSFEGAYQLILRLASIFKVSERGDSLVADMKNRVLAVQEKVAKISTRPKVYMVIGFGKMGDYTAGGNTFIHDMITMAGGKNIASEVQGWSFSLEKIIENDPDIIIIRPGDKEVFSKLETYTQLRAVRTGRIYEVNNDLLELTGPRLVDGLEALFSVFHP